MVPSNRCLQLSIVAALFGAACAGPDSGEAQQAVQGSLSLWNNSVVPDVPVDPDISPVELGVKIRVDVPGQIVAVRFYRGVAIDSGYEVSLWSATGARLASGRVIEGQAPTPGWQQVWVQPINVVPGETYVASYFASAGGYASEENRFVGEVRTSSLVAPSSSAVGGNGVYRYASTSGFPTSTYRDSNYFVDVVFIPTPVDDGPPSVPTDVTATGVNHTEVELKFRPSIDGSGETRGNVESHLIYRNGALLAEIPGTFDFYRDTTLDPLTPYTYQVAGRDDEGNSSALSQQATATTPATRNLAECPCNLWQPGDPRFETADRTAAELGVRFSASVDGELTGIRYYKGSGDNGPNVGHLWNEAGQLIATTVASVPQPGDFGWKVLPFVTPVPIVRNQLYVASYFAPAGGYAITPSYFSGSFSNSATQNYPLSTDSTRSSVRRMGSTGFPASGSETTNFWVDVVFKPATTAR
jgi:hypothetical protein